MMQRAGGRVGVHVCAASWLAIVALHPEARACVQSSRAAETAPRLSPEITAADIRAHVETLAADAMEGRSTGTAGGERAERYLASVLQEIGLEPGGDEGTFLQAVPLRRSRATSDPVLVLRTANGEEFRAEHGRDYTIAIRRADFDELPIRIVRESAAIPTDARWRAAVWIDAFTKKRDDWLAERGHARGAGLDLVVQIGSATAGTPAPVSRERSGLRRADATVDSAPPWIRLRGPVVERFKRGDFATLSLHFAVDEEAVSAHNVVGVIRGAGGPDAPALGGEAIVVSAHHDHLGMRIRDAGESDATASSGGGAEADRVFNGADDDASGCAAVLELAGACAAGPKPARTLVFLFATGEEIGLFGTEHYLDHPLVPLDRTVLNLNFEMIGRPDAKVGGAGTMWLTGFELSNLGPAFEAAGLAVRRDPRPEEHFFERSDNYAFVRRGIVGQSLSTFDLHTDYHGVDDEADRIDYSHMEACIRSALRALRPIADGELRPEWSDPKARAPKAR